MKDEKLANLIKESTRKLTSVFRSIGNNPTIKLIIFGILCYMYKNGFFESSPAAQQLVGMIIGIADVGFKICVWFWNIIFHLPVVHQIAIWLQQIPLP